MYDNICRLVTCPDPTYISLIFKKTRTSLVSFIMKLSKTEADVLPVTIFLTSFMYVVCSISYTPRDHCGVYVWIPYWVLCERWMSSAQTPLLLANKLKGSERSLLSWYRPGVQPAAPDPHVAPSLLCCGSVWLRKIMSIWFICNLVCWSFKHNCNFKDCGRPVTLQWNVFKCWRSKHASQLPMCDTRFELFNPGKLTIL